ncbi:MAG: RNA polymerase sigma factor [Blastocatellia bacterium]
MTPKPTNSPAINDLATEDLVRQFKLGSNREECFEKIYSRHSGMVTRFFIRKGFPRHEAVDLAQETFISVYKGLDDFRQDDRFKSWLFTIALNIFRSELERRGAKKRAARTLSLDQEYTNSQGDSFTLGASVADTGLSPEEEILHAEELALLHAVMLELPDQQRRCVHMRVVEGCTYQEIADRLGIALGTVKAHIFQAKASMRNKFRPFFEQKDMEN